MEFVAGAVWDDIADLVAASVRKRAAIAYAGKDAPQLLPLGPGDTIVVDASDNAVQSGATDPAALAAWMRSGAVVKSLPGLHAKVLLLEDADGDMTAVIGSANASARSRDALLEAAVVSGDESVCDALSEQLAIWTVFGDRIDDAALAHARNVYRPPQLAGSAPRQRRVRIDETVPLWIGEFGKPARSLSRTVERVREQVQRRYGRGAVVEAWSMPPGDERKVQVGQNVVLVNNPNERTPVHGNSTAWAPAEVAYVHPGVDRQRPVAVLVGDIDSESVRFADVTAAVASTGDEIDWDNPLPPAAARAVYDLWH